MKNLKFRYYLICKLDYRLSLFDRKKGKEIYNCIGFKSMYDFIKDKNINFNDIILKQLSFYNLFKYYIDISSIDSSYKGGVSNV
ncbi:MAG: hypothetical protein J6D28_05210 [Bacilli bacterium]|nr:hypothetical protein [Bacilli bacterium]MBP3920948.1 hypothetical protein [Bacilli bacterium]